MYDGSGEDLCPRREPANGPFIRYRNMEILPRWCLGLLRGTPTHLESVILPWAEARISVPSTASPGWPHAPNIRSINREQVYICRREVSLYSFPRKTEPSPSPRPRSVPLRNRNKKKRRRGEMGMEKYSSIRERYVYIYIYRCRFRMFATDFFRLAVRRGERRYIGWYKIRGIRDSVIRVKNRFFFF